MNKTNFKNAGIKASLVQSFYFSTSLTKNTIDEYISVWMSEIGVHVFGYNRQNDEYWGSLKINKNNNVTFTMVTNKSIYENTMILIIALINIFNYYL